MRFLLALAAFALAFTSVTAASSACAPDISQSVHAGAAMSADCHHASEASRAAGDANCNLAAHCAFLCGVAPPGGPDDLISPVSFAINFAVDFHILAGAGREPEAPPPRLVSF